LKLILKILLGLALLLTALALWVSIAYRPEPFPAGSESAARLRDGPYDVGRFDEVFVDRERPTQANGDFPGSPQRELPGSVWYPLGSDASNRPLLLFSHGFTSLRSNGRYLAEHLASYGYVVAAVNFPLTSAWAPGGALVEDVLAQPGDLSFLIDTLSAYDRISGHALSGKVDNSRVGVFGISLGGLTSTLAAYHPQLRDPRIGAAVSIAGPSNFFTPRFFTHADLPFLMLAGELDVIVPWASNAEPLPRKNPGARLVTVLGGSHTGFSHGSAYARMLKNTDAIGCASVTRFIEEDANARWAGLFGDASLGFDYTVPDELCRVDPLPRAINVLRQQMIARVVVRAFFDSVFSPDPNARAAARAYLDASIDRELDDVAVSGVPARGAGR
jgi:dienelactone hydrolase